MEPFSDLDAQLIWVIESFTHVIPVELQQLLVEGAVFEAPPIQIHIELASSQFVNEDTEHCEAVRYKEETRVPF